MLKVCKNASQISVVRKLEEAIKGFGSLTIGLFTQGSFSKSTITNLMIWGKIKS